MNEIKAILITFGFGLGLGLIFLIFHLLGRPLVTGIVFPGSTPLRGKRRLMIGDYTILNELGRGGMGTVFKAISRQGRTVAIKVIGGVGLNRRAGASGRNRVGLVHEARLAASLRHQNIVQIFDVGREEQTLYVVMEYLEGVPLSLYIRNHRPGVLEALRIVAELCDAISYAHGRGVVHRDIKPANIFITTDKTVKVLDFGLAYQGDEVKDSPGPAGTFAYMSPEQFVCRDIDARSDVWSAGITLFEILTGRCPFVGKDLSSLRPRIIEGSLPELPSELPSVFDLKIVLEKALAKNRDARYQTAAAFAVDLRSVISKIEQSTSVDPDIVPPATIQDPALANESPERTLVPKPATKNLGFGIQFRAEVFVTEPSTKEQRFVGGNISGLDGLPGLVAGAAMVALVFVAGYRWSLFAVDALWFCGALTALMTLGVLGLLCRRAYELIFPPQVLQCRSCQRRMRTASDWRRSVWLVDREGLGVPDCLTALKENNWEDAMTLFLVHTTAERTDTWARLTFLECKSCRDQRAYFWFPIPTHGQLDLLWSEAYKFFNPRKAQEFAKAEKLRTEITHPISTENTVDLHDQITM